MFSDDIQSLYQEMILDHGRSPRFFYELENPDHVMEGFNPVCGDQVKVFIKEDEDGFIESSFSGHGCAISMAATSLLLEMSQGNNRSDILQLIKNYRKMVIDKKDFLDDSLGKLIVLAGVRAYPSRIKCATLGCHALKLALEKSVQKITSTE